MPSLGLQNLPSGRLRTALGQILEALGRHLLQSPSEIGGILAQTAIGPFIDPLQSALAVRSNLGFYREKGVGGIIRTRGISSTA